MCVRVCVYVCARMYAWMSCFVCPLHYSLETASLIELGIRLATSKPEWSSYSCPSQHWELGIAWPCLVAYTGIGDSNSGPPAYEQTLLPVEPSPALDSPFLSLLFTLPHCIGCSTSQPQNPKLKFHLFDRECNQFSSGLFCGGFAYV